MDGIELVRRRYRDVMKEILCREHRGSGLWEGVVDWGVAMEDMNVPVYRSRPL